VRVMGSTMTYLSPVSLMGCGTPATPFPAAPTGVPATSAPFMAAQPTEAPAEPTAAPAATSAPSALRTETPIAAPKQEQGQKGQQARRTRSFFPERLFVNPKPIRDENGHAQRALPLADSITTWRLAALANSQNGELGTAQAGIRVFQDFFIDLDLPV